MAKQESPARDLRSGRPVWLPGERALLTSQPRPSADAWLAWLARVNHADPLAALRRLVLVQVPQEDLLVLLIDLHLLKVRAPATRALIGRTRRALAQLRLAHTAVAQLIRTQAGALVERHPGVALLGSPELLDLRWTIDHLQEAAASRRENVVETHLVARLVFFVHGASGRWHDTEISSLVGLVTGREDYSPEAQNQWRLRHRGLLRAMDARLKALKRQESESDGGEP